MAEPNVKRKYKLDAVIDQQMRLEKVTRKQPEGDGRKFPGAHLQGEEFTKDLLYKIIDRVKRI
jgi:hypothetical protein